MAYGLKACSCHPLRPMCITLLYIGEYVELIAVNNNYGELIAVILERKTFSLRGKLRVDEKIQFLTILRVPMYGICEYTFNCQLPQ